jgi:hypothetical protein
MIIFINFIFSIPDHCDLFKRAKDKQFSQEKVDCSKIKDCISLASHYVTKYNNCVTKKYDITWNKKRPDRFSIIYENKKKVLRCKNKINKDYVLDIISNLKDDMLKSKDLDTYKTDLQILDKICNTEEINSADRYSSIESKASTVEEGPSDSRNDTFKIEEGPSDSRNDTFKIEETPFNSENDTFKIEETPFNSENDTFMTETPFNSENDTFMTETPFNSRNDTFKIEETPFNSENDTFMTETPFNSENDTFMTETPFNSRNDTFKIETPFNSRNDTFMTETPFSLGNDTNILSNRTDEIKSANDSLNITLMCLLIFGGVIFLFVFSIMAFLIKKKSKKRNVDEVKLVDCSREYFLPYYDD